MQGMGLRGASLRACLAALGSAAVVMVAAVPASAAPSDLDPTFGPVSSEPGQWRDDFPTDKCPGRDHAQGVAVQSSTGKVVVAGYGARDLTAPCDDPPVNRFVVARLDSSGNLDNT